MEYGLVFVIIMVFLVQSSFAGRENENSKLYLVMYHIVLSFNHHDSLCCFFFLGKLGGGNCQ